MAKSRNRRKKRKNSFTTKPRHINRGKSYCATNILNSNKDNPKVKISLIINGGDNTTIDYSKVMCFKPEDVQKQYKWSFERDKYHPQTKKIIHKYYDAWNLKQVFSSYATIQHKQIIGLLECFLWSLEVMKAKGKFMPLFCQYPEANLHPHQQSVLADIFQYLTRYGEKLEKQCKINNKINPESH